MFAFGHVMLPVVGIIAVGLLVVGVKLFFLPSPPEEPPVVRWREPTPFPTLPPDPTEFASEDISGASHSDLSEDRRGTGEVVAVPKGAAQRPEKPPKDKGPISSPPPATPRKALTPSPRPREEAPPSGIKWGVQIGAFTERFQADALGAKARQQGYTVVVVSATVSGKQYFRVRVVAGPSKGSAEELQEKLKKEGYPTIVVRL